MEDGWHEFHKTHQRAQECILPFQECESYVTIAKLSKVALKYSRFYNELGSGNLQSWVFQSKVYSTLEAVFIM